MRRIMALAAIVVLAQPLVGCSGETATDEAAEEAQVDEEAAPAADAGAIEAAADADEGLSNETVPATAKAAPKPAASAPAKAITTEAGPADEVIIDEVSTRGMNPIDRSPSD